MKVVFFPGAAGIDAAGCYRCIFPMGYLQALGHEASMPPMLLEDAAGELVRPLPGPGVLNRVPAGHFTINFTDDFPGDADVYVFHAGTKEFQVRWAAKLKERTEARIVLDLDDALFSPMRGSIYKRDPADRRFQRQLLDLADVVTCSTPALAEFYGRFNPNTVVLRNRLHWPMWASQPPVFQGRGWRRFRVGYMGSLNHHRADIELIAPSLRRWLERNPDVEFVAAGDPRVHDVIGVPEAQRVSTSAVFFRNLDLAAITATMDVGLVPLVRCDFNECKSALKGMEYAACGIPCIASPTEEYRWWVRDAENGFLARHPKDFIRRLDELVADPAVCGQLGAAAYQDAREASLDQHIHEWETVYAGVLDRSREGRAAEGSAATARAAA